MKKKISLSKRILSLFSALLLCVSLMNLGAVSSFAREYKSGAHIYAGEIAVGDIINSGATIHTADDSQGFKSFDVYFSDEKTNSGETELTLNRKAMLVAREDAAGDKLILHFEDFNTEGDADSEETLKARITALDTINLSGDILMHSALEINDGKKHTINTNGFSICRYVERNSGNVITVTNGSSLTLRNTSGGVSMLHSGAATEGGGIFVDGNSRLAAENITFTHNVSKSGAAVFVKNGSAELSGCTFENNRSEEKGGAVYINGGASAVLKSCRLESNTAYDGGAVCNYGALTVDGCTINGNSANGGGAGIWSKGTATLTKTEICTNLNAVNGGGVINHGDMTLSECTISGNSVSEAGGALYVDTNGKTVIGDSNLISSNSAHNGGGVYVHKGDLDVSLSTFENNVVSEAGGGLWANENTYVTVTGSVFQNNTCKTNGGGLNSHGTLTLNGCTVSSCMSENFGGAVYIDSYNKLTVEGSEIANCTSAKGGGGIYLHMGSLYLAGGKTRIADNTTGGSADNILFRNYQKINISGQFGEGSEIFFTPPKNSVNANVTSGYGQNNSVSAAEIFRCDTNEYSIDPAGDCTEVHLLHKVHTSYSSYNVKVNIRVTDDADWWDYAYLDILAKSGRGKGKEERVNTSGDFHTSVDDDGDEYNYEFDCGADKFPSAVNFKTSFGSWGTWRGFEADVTVYVNGINVCSQHVSHEVYGDEEKNTKINIGGNKYPYPEDFDVDIPADMTSSGVITITAVDQYGLAWGANGENASMQSITYPEEDTFEAVDDSGLKWKLTSTHDSNHISTYEITFLSGSNVYPEITKAINVQFSFPLTMNIVMKGNEIFTTRGYAGDTVVIPEITPPTGYYFNGFGAVTGCSLVQNEKGAYEFTFINESVTLTPTLAPIYYNIVFDKNGPEKEIIGMMSVKTATYDKKTVLSKNKYSRKNYKFEGWNTQADGMGTLYKDKAQVPNLSSKRGDTVTLYAVWAPTAASTTASIFSYGTALIYVGAGIIAAAVIASVIYVKKKKKTE